MRYMKKGTVEEVISYMDDMNISNDLLKEHIMGLSMDKKLIE